jgi:glycine betaine/proline transport system permease protein
VPLGVLLGLSVGIAAYRHPAFERAITPLLDLMQTVPVFAYLVPVLWFFGFSPVAAMVATVIYATPPMVRNTVLALQRVPTEVQDFGRMAGCSRRQMMWKVLIPSARPWLMVGVNQVIMLSLNMVIIASMIGAGGLGHEVLAALRRLDFGAGLEAAMAITLLAIALDRLSQAFARRPPAHGVVEETVLRRHPYLLTALALLLGGWLLAAAWPAIGSYPDRLQVTTGDAVNAGMEWINVHLFDSIEAVKAWLLINLMVPLKRLLLGLPWPMVIAAAALAGWQLGGLRLGLQTAGFGLFIALTGNWQNGMETVYLCGLSVLIACLIGIPIGIWAARNERVHRVAQVVVDTLQTLPALA